MRGNTSTAYTTCVTYDTAGRINGATSSYVDALHLATLLSGMAYNQFGELTQETMGASISSGVQTLLGYDSFGRLQTKVAKASGGSGSTVYSLTGLGYMPDGALKTATDNGSTWSHTYDDLGRILQSAGPSTINFTADRYGNRITENSQTLSYNQDNTIAAGEGITYDAAGNITSENTGATTYNYTYDAENRLISVSGGATATYKYDDRGLRVQSTANGVISDFYYDQGGHEVAVYQNGSLARSELYVGGTHLGTYLTYGGSAQLIFAYQNYLGSDSARTNVNGGMDQACEWNPYGELRQCSYQPTLGAISAFGYAGYERDPETGLDHTWFRYYNPRIGRFMTADPYGGSASLGDPQSMHRNAYVENDPANFLDPMGLQCYDANGKSVDIPNKGDCLSNKNYTWDVPGDTTTNVDGGPDPGIPVAVAPSIQNNYIPYVALPNMGGGASGSTAVGPGNTQDNPAMAGPTPVCQAAASYTMLSQMNVAVTTANKNIKDGWKSNFVDGAGAAAVIFAAGGNLPAAGTFTLAGLAAQGWTILKQVPPVVSSVYNAASQAKQNASSCGGG